MIEFPNGCGCPFCGSLKQEEKESYIQMPINEVVKGMFTMKCMSCGKTYNLINFYSWTGETYLEDD